VPADLQLNNIADFDQRQSTQSGWSKKRRHDGTTGHLY